MADRGYRIKLINPLSGLIIVSLLVIASDREGAAQKNVKIKEAKCAIDSRFVEERLEKPLG